MAFGQETELGMQGNACACTRQCTRLSLGPALLQLPGEVVALPCVLTIVHLLMGQDSSMSQALCSFSPSAPGREDS